MIRPAVVASACALLALLPAARAEGLEAVVPAGAPIFVGVDDVRELRASFAASPWAELLADPAMADLRDAFARTGRNVLDALASRLDVDPIDLLAMVEGPAAFTVLDIDEPAGAPGAQRGVYCVMLDCGERAEEFLDAWDGLVELAEEDADLVRSFEEEDGIGMDVVTGGDRELRYGVVESTVLLLVGHRESPLRARFLDLADGLAGEGPEPLAESAVFRDSPAAHAGASLRAFGDVGGFVRALLDAPGADEQMVATLRETLGLDGFGAFGLALEEREDGGSAHASLRFGEGLVADVAGDAFDAGAHELLALMPADVHQSWSLRIDPVGAFDALVAAILRSQPDARESVGEILASFEAEYDFDLRDDVVASLGGEVAFCSYSAEPGETDPAASFDFCLLAALEDGTSLRTFIDAFVRAQGLHVAREREEFLGYELWHVPFPIGPPIGYAVLDDLLVLSFSEDLMRDVLRRKSGAELPTLGGREDVADAQARLSGRSTFVNVLDGATLARSYIAGLQLLVAQSGLTIDLPTGRVDVLDPELTTATVPDDAVFRRYFDRASVMTVTIGAEGLTYASVTP